MTFIITAGKIRTLIERGHAVEHSIANKLRVLGIIVHEPPKSVRKHYDDRTEHRDGTDLYAWSTSVERWVRVSKVTRTLKRSMKRRCHGYGFMLRAYRLSLLER